MSAAEPSRAPSAAAVRRRLKTRGEACEAHPGRSFDIAHAALDLAALARPGVKLDAYGRHLAMLAREVGAYAPKNADVNEALEALVQVISRRYGYGGGEACFDDLEAANLMRVIDSRRGLPVALGILFIHAARAQNWRASGVDFPGRFLVRLEIEGERLMLDAFEDGKVVRPHDLRELLKSTAGLDAELEPGHYREASDLDVLLRLQNNIKVRLLRAEQLEDALGVINDMLLLAPGHAQMWREAGMIHNRLDRVKDAIVALEEYMRLDSRGESRYSTSVLLQELRSKLN